MKRIIRLTESDLTRIVRRVIMEQEQEDYKNPEKIKETQDAILTRLIAMLNEASKIVSSSNQLPNIIKRHEREVQLAIKTLNSLIPLAYDKKNRNVRFTEIEDLLKSKVYTSNGRGIYNIKNLDALSNIFTEYEINSLGMSLGNDNKSKKLYNSLLKMKSYLDRLTPLN
jgi:hypothetical protein